MPFWLSTDHSDSVTKDKLVDINAGENNITKMPLFLVTWATRETELQYAAAKLTTIFFHDDVL